MSQINRPQEQEQKKQNPSKPYEEGVARQFDQDEERIPSRRSESEELNRDSIGNRRGFMEQDDRNKKTDQDRPSRQTA